MNNEGISDRADQRRLKCTVSEGCLERGSVTNPQNIKPGWGF